MIIEPQPDSCPEYFRSEPDRWYESTPKPRSIHKALPALPNLRPRRGGSTTSSWQERHNRAGRRPPAAAGGRESRRLARCCFPSRRSRLQYAARGRSSAGRALRSQCRGRGFESLRLQFFFTRPPSESARLPQPGDTMWPATPLATRPIRAQGCRPASSAITPNRRSSLSVENGDAGNPAALTRFTGGSGNGSHA